MKVTRLSFTLQPEFVIETAILSCRNIGDNFGKARMGKETHERIRYIFEKKHFGVLEHAQATFHISGITRSCTHQLVRHRMASYAQLSMRAVEPHKVGFITPRSYPMWARMEYDDFHDKLIDFYKRMVADGVPLEDARMCCFIGTETQITVTMNFRSWMHFLKLRLDPKAQWEIRRVAEAIWTSLKHIAPNVFDEKYRKHWE